MGGDILGIGLCMSFLLRGVFLSLWWVRRKGRSGGGGRRVGCLVGMVMRILGIGMGIRGWRGWMWRRRRGRWGGGGDSFFFVVLVLVMYIG